MAVTGKLRDSRVSAERGRLANLEARINEETAGNGGQTDLFDRRALSAERAVKKGRPPFPAFLPLIRV
jgi:hypothetical protein